MRNTSSRVSSFTSSSFEAGAFGSGKLGFTSRPARRIVGIAAPRSIRESQTRASAFRCPACWRPRYVRRIMSSPQRFRVAIHRAKGCYFAHVIDLPGCVARGASEVEAVENARAAIRAFQWVAQVLAGDDPTIQLEISA